jgi:hypothetical protein
MSLDISLIERKTGDGVASMNWLRNPYGLCQWSEDNYALAKSLDPTTIKLKEGLWYPINHWNYEKGSRVNRKLFKQTVDRYGEAIMALEEGFFCFDASELMHFVVPHLPSLPYKDSPWGFSNKHIEGAKRYDQKLAIPMEYFKARCFNLSIPHDLTVLGHYKSWYQQLINFAESLQNPEYQFHCSN